MARLFVCGNGEITIDIETVPGLADALDDHQADALVRCAVLMVLSSLVEGGDWPTDAMRSMITFMTRMKHEVCSTQLM